MIPRALNAPLSWIDERSQGVGVASDEARAGRPTAQAPAGLGDTATIANAASPELLEFLKAWHDWATSGAPDGEPFHREYGLCDNAKCNSLSLSDELRNLFKLGRRNGDFECFIYPFGARDFDDRGGNNSMHECPKRLAWVRATIAAAQGIEAATADETRSGSAVGESPVVEDHAPEPCTQTHTTKKKGE